MHWTLKGWLSHHWWHLKRYWCQRRGHHNWILFVDTGTRSHCKTCGEQFY
jgi:hypothetical protein